MTRWLVILIALGVPPLGEAQRAQLDTAADGSARLDEAALYPLIENVLTWEDGDEAGDESGGASGGESGGGARVPDYDALLADPVAARGELFLLEGRYAGRSRRFGLVRAGVWGDALTEWVLIVRDEPQQVAVVYFVDPDGTMVAPQTGAGVRTVGRFYKVWADRDQAGEPTHYLTFVARSALVTDHAGPPGVDSFALPVLLMIVALAVVYVFLRRVGRSRSMGSRSVGRGSGSGRDVMLSDRADTTPSGPLPDDPAQALHHLAEQHRDP